MRLVLAFVFLWAAALAAVAQDFGNIPAHTFIGNSQSSPAPPTWDTFANIAGGGAIQNSNLTPGPLDSVKGTLNGANVIDMLLPNCQATAGNHLNYTSGTGFSCGTNTPIIGNPGITPGPANTVKGTLNGSSTVDVALPSCADSAGQHLNYVLGVGFGCGTGAPITTNASIQAGSANTVKGTLNGTQTIDVPLLSCPDSGGNHLNWYLGSGFACGSTTPVITNGALAAGSANTYKGSLTGNQIQDLGIPGCLDVGGQHLNYITNSGLQCGNSSAAMGGQNPVSGAYQIQPSDCGKIVNADAGGAANIAFTSPPTGFPADCRILLVNTDGTGSPPAAKMVYNVGQGPWQLFVYQSSYIGIINGGWFVIGGSGNIYRPIEYKPISQLKLYAAAGGNDSADCATSATACTLSHVCTLRNAINTTVALVDIYLNDGIYSSSNTPLVGGSLCYIVGNAGGTAQSLTQIYGNANTPTNTTLIVPNQGVGVNLQDYANVELHDLTFGMTSGTNGQGVFVRQHTIVDLWDMNFENFGSGSLWITCVYLAICNIDSSIVVTGTTIDTAISVQYGAWLIAQNGNAEVVMEQGTGSLTITGQFLSIYGGNVAISTPALQCADLVGGAKCSAVTGLKFSNDNGCLLIGADPNIYLPGSRNGVMTVNACTDWHTAYNVSDISCGGAPGYLYGVEYWIKDATVNTWGTNLSGGGSNIVLAACSPNGGLTVVGK